jgi:hypothetical protein
MSDKVKVVKVEIPFSENSWFQRVHKGKLVTVATIGDATCLLIQMARDAPTMGYDKTDFRITWEDGYIYEGRYDLHHLGQQQENPNRSIDLADHVRGFVLFCSGTRRPHHLTEEQYEQCLKTWEMTPDKRQECLDWLAKYEL